MAPGERQPLERRRRISQPAAFLGVELLDTFATRVEFAGRGLGAERPVLEGLERVVELEPVVILLRRSRRRIGACRAVCRTLFGGPAKREPTRRRVGPFGD